MIFTDLIFLFVLLFLSIGSFCLACYLLIKLDEKKYYSYKQCLIMVDNNLSEIPESAFENKKLEYINLSRNKLITEMDVSEMHDLSVLNMSNNKITYISSIILSHPTLTNINFGKNQISKIHDIQKYNNSLEYLHLEYNKITVVPESISLLPSLTLLNLRKNNLSNIPDSIGELEQLIELNLSNNELTYIPETINKLKNLLTLHIGKNKLCELPDMNNLTLQQIYLKGNNFIDPFNKFLHKNVSGAKFKQIMNCEEMREHFDLPPK